MSRRNAAAASAVSAAIFALLLAALLFLSSDPTTDVDSRSPAALAGWSIRSGAADALVETLDEDSGGARLRAKDVVTITRDSSSIEIGAGSELELASGADSDSLPDLTSGRLVVTTTGDLAIGSLRVAASGADPARFVVTPELVEVLRGSVAVGGRVLGPGSVFFRGTGVATTAEGGAQAEDEPFPAVTSTRRGSRRRVAPLGASATGRVLDARDGRPLAGVRVRATYSESPDGYPPHPPDDEASSVSTIQTDADGLFRVPPFRLFDPRLDLHLELDRDGYLPLVRVIEDEPTLDGTRPFVTLRLRPAETTRVFVLAPDGAPLTGTAVRVSRNDTFDRFVGEDTWDEREARRTGVSSIRYTDESGAIRIGLTTHRFEVLHPLLHMWSLELQDVSVVESFPPSLPREFWHQPFVIRTAEFPSREYEVLDLERRPVANTLLEIDLEGMPPIRTYTDDAGVFEFAPWPRRKDHPKPLSFRYPREGKVTARGAAMWNRGADVALPSFEPKLTVNGRLAPSFSLRCVVFGDSPDEPNPIAAHDVHVTRDGDASRIGATLVHRDLEGRVTHVGELPPSGSFLSVFVRGFLPARVAVPRYPEDGKVESLDIGDVVFERGDVMEIRIADAGLDESRRRGHRPEILFRDRGAGDPVEDGLGSTRDLEYPPHDQVLPITGSVLRAGGLLRGRWYDIRVEGTELVPFRHRFEATERTLEEGIDIVLRWEERVETRVTALSDNIRKDDRGHYRVVERFFTGSGGRDPIIFASYPLPPDGRAGSVRWLPPTTSVETFVISPGGFRGGSDRRGDFDGDFVYDLGRIQVGELRSAAMQFRVKGLGPVPPPSPLALEADVDRNHEIAFVDAVRDQVVIRNLLPGRYVLRWGDHDTPRGAHSFEVESDDFHITDVVYRRPGIEERVLVRVENAEARPIDDVVITRSGESSPIADTRPRQLPDAAARFAEKRSPILSAFTGAGYYWMPLQPRTENRFLLTSQGAEYLPARLVVPRGVEIDGPIVLRTAARATGRIVDIDGRVAQGSLRVRWRSLGEPAIARKKPRERSRKTKLDTSASPGFEITHGEPFTVALSADGRFDTKRFPPGRNRFVFELENTDAKAKLELELKADKRNDIGDIELSETRSLRGRIFLADGSPAPGAVVALSRSASAYRLPQRELRLDKKPFSARTDELGHFEIDGLPMEIGVLNDTLGSEIALIAHLDGWNDAVDDPVDFDLEEHSLVLLQETELIVNASYADGRAHEDFAFRLEFEFLRAAIAGTESAPASVIDLGPLPATRRGDGPYVFTGVTPGVYRLSWDLVEPHPSSKPRSAELLLEPETVGQLKLRVRDTFCQATAVLNGGRLADGWALVTDNPGDPNATRMGRIIDGEGELPVASTDRAWVALIPNLTPAPTPNFFRGEVLPVEYEGYRFDVRKRRLEIRYNAYTLTYELPESHRAYRDIEVEFPHYVWEQRSFRVEKRSEPIQGNGVRLFLLPPGQIALRFTSPSGFRHFELIDLRSHRDVRFRPTGGR